MSAWGVATMDGGVEFIASTKRECVEHVAAKTDGAPVHRVRAGLYEVQSSPATYWIGTLYRLAHEGWDISLRMWAER